jgi:hypothetical protein
MRNLLSFTILPALALAACGGGGHGGGSGAAVVGAPVSGNLGVDAVLPILETSVRSGAAKLDASITTGSIDNPDARRTSSTETVALGTKFNDGTLPSAEVVIEGKQAPDGSGSTTTTVRDPTTKAVYILCTITETAPKITFRTPRNGLAAIRPDGNGTALIIMRKTYDSTTERRWDDPPAGATKTLCKSGSVLGTTALERSVDREYEDWLLVFTLSNNGTTARLTRCDQLKVNLVQQRLGGPTVSDPHNAFDRFRVGGLSIDPANDPLVPIGGDLTPGAAQRAALDIAFTGYGGPPNTHMTVNLFGPFTPSARKSNATADVLGTLDMLAGVDDHALDTGDVIYATSTCNEGYPLVIEHSLDRKLGVDFPTVGDILYLPCRAGEATGVVLVH